MVETTKSCVVVKQSLRGVPWKKPGKEEDVGTSLISETEILLAMIPGCLGHQ
jgi:hypothetical protein